VGITFEAAEADETHAPGCERDDDQHGQDGRQPEGCGHQDDAADVVPGRRIHDERNQRLARSEDENGKENPGCDIGFARPVMDMGVTSIVRVGMGMGLGRRMVMDVRVRPVPQGPVQPPDKVGQPETDEKPGRQAPPEGLHPLKLRHCNAQADAQEAEEDRAQNMSQPAEERDDEGSRKRPSPRPGHDDEWKVVVGADDGVDEAY